MGQLQHFMVDHEIPQQNGNSGVFDTRTSRTLMTQPYIMGISHCTYMCLIMYNASIHTYNQVISVVQNQIPTGHIQAAFCICKGPIQLVHLLGICMQLMLAILSNILGIIIHKLWIPTKQDDEQSIVLYCLILVTCFCFRLLLLLLIVLLRANPPVRPHNFLGILKECKFRPPLNFTFNWEDQQGY